MHFYSLSPHSVVCSVVWFILIWLLLPHCKVFLFIVIKVFIMLICKFKLKFHHVLVFPLFFFAFSFVVLLRFQLCFQCVFFINIELYLYPTMIGSFSERIQYSIMIDTAVMIDLLCNFLQFTLYLCYFHQVNRLIVFPEVGFYSVCYWMALSPSSLN